MVSRILAVINTAEFAQNVLVADDTFLHKIGKEMELVSYHFDHTNKHSNLGYQMLKVGYYNGIDFYPVDVSSHFLLARYVHQFCKTVKEAMACVLMCRVRNRNTLSPR